MSSQGPLSLFCKAAYFAVFLRHERELNSMALVHEGTIPTERPQLVSEVSANFCVHVIRVTDPYGCILGFIDRRHYFFSQVASQLYSRG
jgi:hypothetical protein